MSPVLLHCQAERLVGMIALNTPLDSRKYFRKLNYHKVVLRRY